MVNANKKQKADSAISRPTPFSGRRQYIFSPICKTTRMQRESFEQGIRPNSFVDINESKENSQRAYHPNLTLSRKYISSTMLPTSGSKHTLIKEIDKVAVNPYFNTQKAFQSMKIS